MRQLLVMGALTLLIAGCPKNQCSTNSDCTNGQVCSADKMCVDGVADAGPVAYGTLLLTDLTLQDHPELGRGARVDIFFGSTAAPASLQHIDERNALGVGCTGDLWTASQYAAQVSKNEGTVTVTGTTQHLPACTFVAPDGYFCVASSNTAQTTILAAADSGGALTAGTAKITLAGATFTTEDVGRTLVLGGAANGANVATFSLPFPIISLGSGAGEIVVGNANAVSEGPFAGGYTVLAGAGPVPGGPAFLSDTDSVSVALSAGGDQDFASFTASGLFPGTAFHLDTASAALINALPTNGTSFHLSCDPTGGNCGNATAAAVNIVTTDTALPPGAPIYAMPAATSKVATVTCTALGNTATVSANASALIQAAAPKRIQTAFVRVNIAQEVNSTPPANTASIALGHGIAGFTAVP